MNRKLPFVLLMMLPAVAELSAAELGHSKTAAHSDNPVLRAEHLESLELVPNAAVTHAAVQDGLWSEKATWKGSVLPEFNANVLIPTGKTVTLDHISEVALRTVRIDGKLQFAHDRDTALLVDTLVVASDGALVIGTAAQPIAAGKQARLIFADRGPIDTRWDPKQFSHGLISHGSIVMHGAPKTAHAVLARAPRQGDTRLVLSQPPANWKKGDQLIVPSTSLRGKDEQRRILDVAGTEVAVEALADDHAVPAEGLFVPVANVTRNVILESQNASDISRAGHVMFMHSPDVTVENVAFHDLGRTDKRKPVNDPKLDDKKIVLDGTGTNPRGRYAVHFHRTGTHAGEQPAVVKGSVVLNSPGWGFVNHSSHVAIEDNVAFNVTGSAFVTEAGDEIGTFRRNLAIRSVGSGDDVSARTQLQDFGHEGDGFWFQGGGVTVEDNIAAGQAQSGFIYFTSGLIQAGLGKMRFATANLQDPSWAGEKGTVEVGQVPIRSFKRNVCFASHTGILPRHHLSGLKDGGPACPHRSIIEDSVVWNTLIGVHVRYSANVTLRNLRLVGNTSAKNRGRVGVLGQIEEIRDIHCENLDVQGWQAGVDVRESGSWVIDGGTYKNNINILIPTTIERGRVVRITGDIRFAESVAASPEHYDIYLGAEFGTTLGGKYGYRNPNHLFVPDVIEYQGRQLYYLEQAADYVPLRKDLTAAEPKKRGTAEGSVPEELIGKTNRELWDRYGLAIAGTIAPADTVTAPRIHALIGPKARYPQPEIVNHPYTSDKLEGFQLVCYAAGKQKVAESDPTDLQPGWNLLSLTIADHRRSFLVYGGKSPSSDKAYDKKGK